MYCSGRRPPTKVLLNYKSGPSEIRTHDLSMSELILSVERSSQAELPAPKKSLDSSHLSLFFPLYRTTNRRVKIFFNFLSCKKFLNIFYHSFFSRSVFWLHCIVNSSMKD